MLTPEDLVPKPAAGESSARILPVSGAGHPTGFLICPGDPQQPCLLGAETDQCSQIALPVSEPGIRPWGRRVEGPSHPGTLSPPVRASLLHDSCLGASA